MIDGAFFLTVAGIAMSFAGFAGLMNTLRRRGDGWAPMELYQLRIIVANAIATLFGSLSNDSVRGTLRRTRGCAVARTADAHRLLRTRDRQHARRHQARAGHGLRTRVRAVFATITILGLVAFLGTAVTGALPLYQVALILMLAMPAGTFVYVVSRIER